MSEIIWKYPIPVADDFTIIMPEGGKVLVLQVQGTEPQIWVMVNPEAPSTKRRFQLYGTGRSITEGHLEYIGTFQVYTDRLVFHLFEVLDAS